jgi:hypothetical protein
MLIRVGCEIEFDFPEPTAVILMLSLHPVRAPTIRGHEQLQVEPAVPVSQFFDNVLPSPRHSCRPIFASRRGIPATLPV